MQLNITNRNYVKCFSSIVAAAAAALLSVQLLLL